MNEFDNHSGNHGNEHNNYNKGPGFIPDTPVDENSDATAAEAIAIAMREACAIRCEEHAATYSTERRTDVVVLHAAMRNCADSIRSLPLPSSHPPVATMPACPKCGGATYKKSDTEGNHICKNELCRVHVIEDYIPPHPPIIQHPPAASGEKTGRVHLTDEANELKPMCGEIQWGQASGDMNEVTCPVCKAVAFIRFQLQLAEATARVAVIAKERDDGTIAALGNKLALAEQQRDELKTMLFVAVEQLAAVGATGDGLGGFKKTPEISGIVDVKSVLQVVRGITEFPGEIPASLMEKVKADPVKALREVVHLTKVEIGAEILKLLSRPAAMPSVVAYSPNLVATVNSKTWNPDPPKYYQDRENDFWRKRVGTEYADWFTGNAWRNSLKLFDSACEKYRLVEIPISALPESAKAGG